jgi:EAL domain
MAMRRPAGPRVVFLPGTLGSVLVDQSLTQEQAREECRRNLGPDRDRRWRGKPWYPCDKLDKSFVLNMTGDPDDAAIVRSTIELAHNLGLQLVAEGVEDQETLELLASLGCDLAQGFHLARPMPPADLARLAAGDTRTHPANGLR